MIATSLKQREWIQSEPGEDIPHQYSSIEGHLTPNMPRSEDMRLDPSLNMTPEGSITDIPTVVQRETREQVPKREMLGISSETTYMDIPSTHVKQYIKVLLGKHPKSYEEQRRQVEKKH